MLQRKWQKSLIDKTALHKGRQGKSGEWVQRGIALDWNSFSVKF